MIELTCPEGTGWNAEVAAVAATGIHEREVSAIKLYQRLAAANGPCGALVAALAQFCN
jgi:hypothetical protein